MWAGIHTILVGAGEADAGLVIAERSHAGSERQTGQADRGCADGAGTYFSEYKVTKKVAILQELT